LKDSKDSITQENFDRLLNWLDPERSRAGEKYEAIRLRLIKIFVVRGCIDADALADETINRVTRKVEEVSNQYVGDPSNYFYAVARKVYLEYLRVTSRSATISLPDQDVERIPIPAPALNGVQETEVLLRATEECLKALSKENRDLLFAYYMETDNRKTLAHQVGVTQMALRQRMHRLRIALRRCIESKLSYE
jgi:RNA polymerase sigma factor (sigma-70 family)